MKLIQVSFHSNKQLKPTTKHEMRSQETQMSLSLIVIQSHFILQDLHSWEIYSHIKKHHNSSQLGHPLLALTKQLTYHVLLRKKYTIVITLQRHN